jgi:segregation and condensation protein B
MESGNRVETGRLASEIEALLFASDTPISVGRLSSITGESSAKTIKEAIGELEEFYRSCGRSFGIVEVAGGYQIATLPEFAPTVSLLFKSRRKSRLTQAALETLAIIAYRQPISRAGVEAIRGVNCDGVLATLTERELVAISGRGEGLGRPFLYSTTSTFLEYLGLKDIRDIPDMAELEKSLETLELIPPPAHPDEDVEKPTDTDGPGYGNAEEDDGTDEP